MDDLRGNSWSGSLERLGVALLCLGMSCLALGCGSSHATVSGNVLLNDQPLNNGMVSFVPEDGRPPTSAEIRDGNYEVTKLPPGKFTVVVSGFEVTDMPLSSAEMAAQAEQGGQATEPREIPADAQGNSVVLQVTGNAQQLDLAIVTR